ncbi:carbohydrate sulfotransferase 1-like [Ostrea edulis]|uniref:carbohydrate sulfotransferase 1-like n=1 Tax=Ostrea edulis TaxID=37623 RepID=UPI0024AF178B|nr:carbohydrate sulfotransferase 1-like [Ostrea edulis]
MLPFSHFFGFRQNTGILPSRRFFKGAQILTVFLGFYSFCYICTIARENGTIRILSSLRLNNFLCLSLPKPPHLSDNHFSTRHPPMNLIVAYMRSGSTLTANMVRHNEGDFYMFEPLHGITQAVQKTSPVQFLNGTKRMISRRELFTVYAELLYHWFTCNFAGIDITALTHPFIVQYTPELGEYYRCINPKTSRRSKTENVKMCLTWLHKRCVKSKSRTIKTIRLPISMAGKLLDWLPSLKIIHLIRDPRGILNSQFEKLVNDGKNMSTAAEELCQSISNDLSAYEDLQYCHKNRITRIIYEDMCENPFVIVPKLYEFLNTKYTKRVNDYVKWTMTGPVRSCDYCTNKGNALMNAYRWISIIPRHVIQTFDTHCSFLYPKLGYQNLDYDKLNITERSWLPGTSH